MSLSLTVYRKVTNVDESVIEAFPPAQRRETSGGWLVNNDWPLPNNGLAQELIDNTKGFALALPDGDIVGEFKTVMEADKARSAAKVSFVADVQGVRA